MTPPTPLPSEPTPPPDGFPLSAQTTTPLQSTHTRFSNDTPSSISPTSRVVPPPRYIHNTPNGRPRKFYGCFHLDDTTPLSQPEQRNFSTVDSTATPTSSSATATPSPGLDAPSRISPLSTKFRVVAASGVGENVDALGRHSSILSSSTVPLRSRVLHFQKTHPRLQKGAPMGTRATPTSARPEAFARNASLDSTTTLSSNASQAPSLVSTSTMQSNPGPRDAATPPAHSAQSYIAEVGDPIQAVERLLKETRALTVKNDKLWSIVEKQKLFVQDLHVDMERTCRERDKYRKRLKQIQQETIPAIPHNPAIIPENGSRRDSKDSIAVHKKAASLDKSSSASSTRTVKATATSNHVRDQTSQLSLTSSEDASRSGTPQDPGKSTQHNFQQHAPNSDMRSLGTSRQYAPSYESQIVQGPASVQTLSSPGEKARKAAPAPLNLSQTNSPTYQNIQSPTSLPSGSDYGDGLHGEETPESDRDRGRRRTRQEDDRDREALAMIEEARSRSTKSSKSSKSSKSKGKGRALDGVENIKASPISTTVVEAPTSRDEAPMRTPAVGLPSSPRAALNGDIPTVGSIASALAPRQPNPTLPNESQAVTLQPKSPGLPLSPRPGNRPVNAPMPRVPTQEFAAPGPLSPRQGLPLSPRAPRHPIPLPASASVPNFPTSARGALGSSENTSMAERLQSGIGRSTHQDGPSNLPSERANNGEGIFKGLMSPEFPSLLIAPESLTKVATRVLSSRLRPSRNASGQQRESEADLIFTLAVTSKFDSRQLWWLEKRPAALTNLDSTIRKDMNLAEAVPDRGLFSGHSPAKLAARRASINQYFEGMLNSPMRDKVALQVCRFLSTDVIAPESEERPLSPAEAEAGPSSPRLILRKEGMLSKKGQHFGGWKERYFILETGLLKHHETSRGPLLGNIKLPNALINRTCEEGEHDPEFRHAFEIHEPKRRNADRHVRHILAAESDEERNAWVAACLLHVGGEQQQMSPPSSPIAARTPSFNTQRPTEPFTPHQRSGGNLDSLNTSHLQAVPYSEIVAAEAPKTRTPTTASGGQSTPITASHPPSAASPAHPNISGPVGGGPIHNSHAWGNKAPSPTRLKDREMKKRSVFGFMRSSDDPGTPGSARAGRGVSPRPPLNAERRNVHAVFGVPLAEAADLSAPVGVDICLPSPVYRCIEYLEAKQAWRDEGLFRLSGSSVVIQTLKDRFDTEGDVKLLEEPLLDVNAVASLLKRYLRELPEPILTNRLAESFRQLTEIDDTRQKLAAMNLLVHKLPEANFDLLVALFRFLIKVASHAATNKMSIKNINIVFSPTINIATPLITLFITEYDSIFTPSVVDEETASPILESLSSFQAASRNTDDAGPYRNGQEMLQPSPALRDLQPSPSLNHPSPGLRKPTGTLHDAISAPVAVTSSTNAAVVPTRNNTSTPPPRLMDDGGYQNGTGPSLAPPASHSSASSSPSSFVSGGGAPPSRKNGRRESGMVGHFGAGGGGGGYGLGIDGPGPKGGLELPGGPPADGTKRKSSYTRLREGMGMGGSVRE